MISLWGVPAGTACRAGPGRPFKWNTPAILRRAGRAFLLTLLVLTVAGGCSRTRIASHFSDWFLLHRIDHYFDLNTEQERFLDARIGAFQAWHRKHELPRWVDALAELERRWADGLSADDVDWAESRYTASWRRMIGRGLPDFSRFLTTVSAAQIRHLEGRFENGDDWLTRQAGLSETELTRDHRDWVEGVFESWYGDLEPEQRRRIQGRVRPDPAWMRVRLENRRKFQRDFVRLLTQNPPVEVIQHRLMRWLHHPGTRWEPGFDAQVERRAQEWKTLIVRVDAMMTPAQRDHAIQRVRGYRRDFQAIAGIG